MNWYDVLNSVQGSNDPRRRAYLMSALWEAMGDGPEWLLTNALMNSWDAYTMASQLDGAGVGLNRAARMLLR